MYYEKLKFSFFGIEVTVESNDSNFLSAVDGGLYFFKQRNDKNLLLVENQNLHVVYLKDREENCNQVLNGCCKIGNNAYLSVNKYIFMENGLIVQITRSDCNLKVVAQPALQTNIKSMIKRTFLTRGIDYYLLVRKLVIFPIFYLLEKKCNIFLLHGSAIEYKGMGVAIAGLAGTGKSTISISLTLQLGKTVKFLTDNFLLFDKEYIYPFPEYIRLHDDILPVIGDTSKLGPPKIRRYKRNHYTLDKQFISSRKRPNILFVPYLSEASGVRQISTDVAIDRLLLAADHVKEFHMYHHFGLIDYLNYDERSTYKQRIEVLEALLSKIKIYELGIPQRQQPCEWWDKIIDYVS